MKIQYNLGDPFVTIDVVSSPKFVLSDGSIRQSNKFNIVVKTLQVKKILIGRAYSHVNLSSYGLKDSEITYILSRCKGLANIVEGAFSPVDNEDFLLGRNYFFGVQQKAFPRIHQLFKKDIDGSTSYVQQVIDQIYRTRNDTVDAVYFLGHKQYASKVNNHD